VLNIPRCAKNTISTSLPRPKFTAVVQISRRSFTVWAKKVSLLIFAITLSTATIFGKYTLGYRKFATDT